MLDRSPVTLFVCGDVMTGRGVDQILPVPSDPRLFEPYVKSAREYLQLAERASGPIPRSVGYDYIWGFALEELKRFRPDARIINLETAVTVSPDADTDKGIHYRMHPANVPCLTAAGIDCCMLANNHVLDWGRRGLEDTLKILHAARIRTTGAGSDDKEAAAPATIDVPAARLLIYGFALWSSGVPRDWKATRRHAGVNWLPGLSGSEVESIGRRIAQDRQPGDLVIVSIHWGGNWGYEISPQQRAFAHGLIETAGVDLIHGHSSHHPKGIEVYRRKAILYGCGDLLNDYEGIGGYESFKSELAVMYFPVLDAATGSLLSLTLVPTRTRKFRINKASAGESDWLADTLDRECHKLGARVIRQAEGALALRWTD